MTAEASKDGWATVELKVSTSVKVAFEKVAETRPSALGGKLTGVELVWWAGGVGGGFGAGGVGGVSVPQVPSDSRMSGAVQAVHWVGEGPEQAAQDESQATQSEPTVTYPGVLQAVHELLEVALCNRKVPSGQAVQLAAVTAQVAQADEQGRQVVPVENVFEPQGVQVPVEALRKLEALQAVQLVLDPVQLRQLGEQGEQAVPLTKKPVRSMHGVQVPLASRKVLDGHERQLALFPWQARQLAEQFMQEPPDVKVPVVVQVPQVFVVVFKYCPTKVLQDVQFVEVTLQVRQLLEQPMHRILSEYM